MKMISINDSYPRNNQQVLVWYKFDPSDGSWDYDEGFKITSFQYGAHVTEYRENLPGYRLIRWDEKMPKFFIENDDRYKVTHWMPLPEKP